MDQKKPLKQKSWARRVPSEAQDRRARPTPLGAPYLMADSKTTPDVKLTQKILINTETPEKNLDREFRRRKPL